MRPRDAELKQRLTDLVIEQNAPRGWRPEDEERKALVEELEEALIDQDALLPILRHLKSIPNRATERKESVFEADEDVISVLEGGLEALHERSPELFFRAVVDPFALLELRDNIYEALTPYWWARIRRAGGREPQAPDEIWRGALEEAGQSQSLPVTAFGVEDAPRRWVATAEGEHVTRIAPADAPAPDIAVEFSLAPSPEGWQLEVILLEPPPPSGSLLSGRLITRAGEEIGRTAGTTGSLVFAVAIPDLLAGLELLCDDHRKDGEHFQFRITVAIS